MSGSRKKFGGGRPPSGTPSLPLSCAVVVVSLLAGASIVHNIYKPDLTLPPVDPPAHGEPKGNDLKSLDVLRICLSLPWFWLQVRSVFCICLNFRPLQ